MRMRTGIGEGVARSSRCLPVCCHVDVAFELQDQTELVWLSFQSQGKGQEERW